jgi:hypothetical protein
MRPDKTVPARMSLNLLTQASEIYNSIPVRRIGVVG